MLALTWQGAHRHVDVEAQVAVGYDALGEAREQHDALGVIKENMLMLTWQGRTDTLTSKRRWPSAMTPSVRPANSMTRRSSPAYAAASAPERMSGSETTSSSGTPARL